MGHSKTQSSVKMKSLLVLAAVSAVALADEEAKPAVLPFGYGYAGLGYAGLGYHGLGYAGLGYPAAVGPAITYAEPKVTDVEVPPYVYKPVVEKVNLAPACHNGAGFPVPCA